VENSEPQLLALEMTRTVLVATSEPRLCQQLHELLETDSLTVLDYGDGDSVLAMVRHTLPDLIILDEALTVHGSSRVDDFELCRQLQYLIDTLDIPTIPIIMLIEDDNDLRVQQAFEAGALDYIVKPVREVVIRQRVGYLLQMWQMQNDLREKEERYRTLSTMISDYAYAYGVSPDGSLVKEWNTKAFQTITGYSPDEMEGDGWSQLIHPDDYERTLQRYRRLLAGESDVSEFRIVTRTGEIRWLLDHGQPVYDERVGRVVRIYGAAKDITESKQAEQILRRQTKELRDRNQELDSFAHTVAHDLKNPIASMMGFASLVLNYYDRMTDDRVKEYLALIMESGYKLKEIINSLLLLASVNKLENIELTPLDMKAIIQETRKRLMTMIDEYQAEIVEPESYPLAVGYAPWVEEIWANYLSNALKYGGTPPRIEFGADEAENGMVRFWIIDNGSGLTPEEQQKVFTPFTRLSQAKIEGHGLGLSVVHTIVQKLGGETGVETADNGGAKFTFTLPAASET
jgi:PAS domain S-box-containing protein